MKFNWVKTNWFLKKLFPSYIWAIPNHENKVYLTFDDGPTPEITEWTLHQLKKYNAKATFFCIGDNIRKYPAIYNKILTEGHAIGNHTYHHLNGWKTNTQLYVDNVMLCEREMLANDQPINSSKLFRPPYGKIKRNAAKNLQKLGYKIIMWDVISYDFDANVAAETCFKNVTDAITKGSIVVFHDSKKAFQNLEIVLPKTLQFIQEKGYVFEKIN